MQSPSGTPHASDIVGRWYDAWDWNGHQHIVLNEFKKDGTGTVLKINNWRTGGGMKTVAELRWNYRGNGSWTVVESNMRTLAGTGRYSAKPFTYSARVMNSRLYDDTRRRTAVNAANSAAVADKNLDMEWTGAARTARNQQIQELGVALDGLRNALNGASAAGLTGSSPPPDGYRKSSIQFGTQTTDITANYPEGYAYDVTTYGGQYATDPQDFITIYGMTTRASAEQNLEAGRAVYGGNSNDPRFRIRAIRVTKGSRVRTGMDHAR